MQVHYFDSSVILSMLLNDSRATEALNLWQKSAEKVSSKLLVFECETLIHRCAGRMPENLASKWAKDARKWLGTCVEQLRLHEIDDSVLAALRENQGFGKCRTLDAIHLATAKIFSNYAEQLSLVTFDTRMGAAAKELGIIVSS